MPFPEDPSIPTRSEIDEMKRRGYDASIIREAEEAYARELLRMPRVRQLCARITQAFAGIELGQGLGLREAESLDGYADEETRSKLRAEDEKNDWRNISEEKLDGYSGTAFLDAEGMRFHLPALMIATLNRRFVQGLIFKLTTRLCEREELKLLSKQQRAVVRDFLQFMLDEVDQDEEHEEIQRALAEYWGPDKDGTDGALA